jgi:capsid protein
VRHNVIQKLPPGTEVKMQAPTHPGANYEPFIKDSQRGQSVKLGMSFEAFANNYTDSSYASARSGSLEERLSYRSQQQFVEEKINRHVMAWYIEAAYLSGLAPVAMPGYAREPHKYHEMAEGQFPGWGWVDPQNDANAAEKLIELKIDTRRNQAAQRGLDWDEVVDEQLDEELRMIELAEARLKRKQLDEVEDAATQ